MTLPGFMPCPDYHLTPAGNRNPSACPDCNGAGQIPNPDTVEAVASAMYRGDSKPWMAELERGKARLGLLAYARWVKEESWKS